MEENLKKDYVLHPEKWEEGKPLVSVIAICHNHAPFLLETLESIRNQTYPNIELIVINNLKDECEGIIKNWILDNELRINFIQNKSILNVSENVNLGVSQSAGKYFQIISCDDIIVNTKIQSQVTVFETLEEDCACVFGDYQKIDEHGAKLSERSSYLGLKDRYFLPEEMRKILATKPFIALQTALVKRDAFLNSGGVDPKYEIEDYYLWISLASKNYSFYLKNEFVAKYRILRSSLWHSRGLKLIEHHLFIRLEFLNFLYGGDNKSFQSLFNTICHYIRSGGDFSEKKFLEVMRAVNIYSPRYLRIIRIYNFTRNKLPKLLSSICFFVINNFFRLKYLVRISYAKVIRLVRKPLIETAVFF